MKKLTRLMVSIPPRSSGAEMHDAINALAEPRSEVHVAAGSLEFATPLVLCGLRALIECAAANAERVIFDCPVDGQVHRYLERMDCYKALPSNVECSSPRPPLRRQDLRSRLIELQHITTADEAENVIYRFWQVARQQFPSRRVARMHATALTGLAENAIEHADSPIGALVAAQVYEGTGLELAIVDLGRGIPASLRRNGDFQHLSDIDAVVRALDDGVSSSGEEGRGAGLFEICNAVAQAAAAVSTVQSGFAQVTFARERGRTRMYTTVLSVPVPGTWISLRVQPESTT